MNEKSSYSSEFDGVSDVNYTVPSRRNRRTGRDDSSKRRGLTSVLPSILKKIDNIKKKVVQVDERLDKLEP